VTAGQDSHNILPALLGEPLSGPIREAVIHHSGNGMFAVRCGRWKLILGLGSGGFSKPSRIEPKESGPTGQLYDIQADPAETKNLYLERPDVVKRLAGLLERYKSAGRSSPQG
jgi:arylsulfatase A